MQVLSLLLLHERTDDDAPSARRGGWTRSSLRVGPLLQIRNREKSRGPLVGKKQNVCRPFSVPLTAVQKRCNADFCARPGQPAVSWNVAYTRLRYFFDVFARNIPDFAELSCLPFIDDAHQDLHMLFLSSVLSLPSDLGKKICTQWRAVERTLTRSCPFRNCSL